MPDAVVLLLAALTNLVGLGWLALSMEVHWTQVRGPKVATRMTVRALRVLGACGLAVSLLLCLQVDHASMAALVWCMTLAGAALAIAFALAWRARWLGWLMPWSRPASTCAHPVDRPAPHSRR